MNITDSLAASLQLLTYLLTYLHSMHKYYKFTFIHSFITTICRAHYVANVESEALGAVVRWSVIGLEAVARWSVIGLEAVVRWSVIGLE